jgi:hypothetical protein
VIDREGRKMGRVDGIIIETGGQGRPRVVSVEVGPTTLAGRLPRPLSVWATALIRRISGSSNLSVSVPWNKITIMRNEVRADIDSDKTDARLIEHWVRDRIIKRIPGA